MTKYTITVYEKDGKKLLEETFEAKDDHEGRQLGEKKLEENGYHSHTSRVTSEKGKLVHFHR